MSNTTTDAMAAFLARGGTVKKCPAAEGNATPLRKLRRMANEAMEAGQSPNVLARDSSGRIDPSASAREFEAIERDAERSSEQAAAMAANGRRCVGFDEYGDAV